MAANEAELADLLHEVAETHHLVFKITDGDDPDWASWYADHLLRLTPFPQWMSQPVVRSELVYWLVRLDKEYAEQQPAERWEVYYARALLGRFG
jgi:hypothetical protein